jgi:predicted  nucleic acid-binding Zn-ribbon protein
MLPDLERLIELQRLETAIAEARKQIAAYPDRVQSAEARLEDARRSVDVAKQRLKTSQDERRALEKDAALYQGRLSKFKDQQAAVKTNREYQALGHEIETAQQELSAIEEKEIEKMVEADGLTADVKHAETAFAAQQKDVDAEKTALARQMTETEASLQQAQAARAQLVTQVPAPLVALFEQVAKGRKGIAVCLAQDGLCSVCHVRLRPHVYQQVRHNDSIIQCDSCQRILHYVPPATPVEPTAPPAS